MPPVTTENPPEPLTPTQGLSHHKAQMISGEAKRYDLRMSFLCFCVIQAELKLTEYHKLARKLKLIPASAENACGHDYEIRANLEYGPTTMVQYKAQVMVGKFDYVL